MCAVGVAFSYTARALLLSASIMINHQGNHDNFHRMWHFTLPLVMLPSSAESAGSEHDYQDKVSSDVTSAHRHCDISILRRYCLVSNSTVEVRPPREPENVPVIEVYRF